MGRLLAIDYGKKRTGIAVSDPLQLIAQGLTTVETPRLMKFLDDYLAHEEVECIIVGMPRQMNGLESENMQRIRPFVNRLRHNHPDLTVDYYDERFTSVLAHRTMLESGIGKMARRDKALVDKISATIILEDYMESLKV